jgi:hypothetical protein
VQIDAEHDTPTDPALIPTGAIVSVAEHALRLSPFTADCRGRHPLRYQFRTPSCSSWTLSRGAAAAAGRQHRHEGLHHRTRAAVLRWRLSQRLVSGARWSPPLPSRRTMLGARTISRRSQSSKYPPHRCCDRARSTDRRRHSVSSMRIDLPFRNAASSAEKPRAAAPIIATAVGIAVRLIVGPPFVGALTFSSPGRATIRHELAFVGGR